MHHADLVATVTDAVRYSLELDLAHSELRPEASLLALGMDSITAVDLTVALEQALGIAAFPIQDWADAESARSEPRFTIASLIATCAALLGVQPSPEATHDE